MADCLERQNKEAEKFKIKMWARHMKDFPKEKPKGCLFALFVQCLMTAALYHTVPPNNVCMLCDLY